MFCVCILLWWELMYCGESWCVCIQWWEIMTCCARLLWWELIYYACILCLEKIPHVFPRERRIASDARVKLYVRSPSSPLPNKSYKTNNNKKIKNYGHRTRVIANEDTGKQNAFHSCGPAGLFVRMNTSISTSRASIDIMPVTKLISVRGHVY